MSEQQKKNKQTKTNKIITLLVGTTKREFLIREIKVTEWILSSSFVTKVFKAFFIKDVLHSEVTIYIRWFVLSKCSF